MRTAARVDANQAEIVDALRRTGATVQLLHMVGRGCPDVLVGYRGVNYLLEIKTETGTLTPDEVWFFEVWHGQACVVRSIEDALKIIGALWLTSVAEPER